MSSPGWYPPQWTQGITSTVSLLVPNVNIAGQGITNEFGDFPTTGQNEIGPTLFIFDAAVRAEDEMEVEITHNPVQTGASLSDHAFLLPTRLVVEFLMSDCMQSYVSGQFSGNASRSVAAYQTLLDIQASFALIQVSTRLKQYSNMLIQRVSAVEDVTTRFAGKFTVVFQQVLIANFDQSNPSNLNPNSTREDAVSRTDSGPVNTTTPPQAVVQNNNVLQNGSLTQPPLTSGTYQPGPLQLGSTVQNSGVWSSTNTSGLQLGK